MPPIVKKNLNSLLKLESTNMPTEKPITKQRIPYYDIAKGLLIIFVAWAHSDNNITNYVEMNYASILPLFVLSISGSVFIVSLCKAIGHMPALEFLGRHSLLIFFLHGHFYLYKFILPQIEGTSYIVMLLFWIISIITAVGIPACISRAMDVKYCRILKGKF